MTLLRSNRTFPFRGFQGKEPTVEELRQELEEVYKFVHDLIRELDEVVEQNLDTHYEPLCANGEIVFANGDVVMVVVPNS